MAAVNAGAIVNFSQGEDGTWTAKQATLAQGLPPTDNPNILEIDWSCGPVKVTGYLNNEDLSVGVGVSVVGINLGPVYGNVKDGIGLNADLFVVRGEIRFHQKNQNAFWVYLKVDTFNGRFEGEYKILDFWEGA